MRSLLMLLAACAALAAQQQTVYFSTRFTETPASGRGGFINDFTPACGNPSSLPQSANPGFGTGFVIESVVTNSQGINAVVPGVPNVMPIRANPGTPMVVDYVELANFTQFNAIIGDLDGDALVQETSNFPGVDAMHVVTGAFGRYNTIHEIFISTFADCTGNQGFLGTNVTEADMILLPSAQNVYPQPQVPVAPVFFIRQSDWETLFSLPGPNNSIDVNAFTVDPATGDIYASFDAVINGVTVIDPTGAPSVVSLQRGDIVRIPGTAYTPAGRFGVVTAPVAGRAELFLPQAEVQALVTAAGCTVQGTSFNVYGLQVDSNPLNPPLITQAGFVGAQLFFTVDNRGTGGLACASAIYTTTGAGYATINGQLMDSPAAAGMNTNSFNNNFFAGPLDALAIVENPFLDPSTNRPIHLDTFPDSGILTDPLVNGVVTAYASGLSPAATAPTLFGDFAVFGTVRIIPAGGFAPRWSVAPIGINGFQDLYVDPFGIAEDCPLFTPTTFFPFCQNPAFQAFFNNGLNPVYPFTDPVNGAVNGDTCFGLNLSSIVPLIPAAGNLVLIFQGLDLTTLTLSDPLMFTLN